MMHPKTTWSLALGLLVCTAPAWATPIAIPLDQDDFPPFGETQVDEPLNQAIEDYNTANGTSYPTSIDETPDIKVATGDAAPSGYPDFGPDTLSITLPVGDYNYLFFHWGGGAGGGTAELWYLGECPDDATAEFTAPTGNGLSFYSFYDPNGTTPVPDGGSMIALIGLGLIATAFAVRHAKSPPV
jgi:hypothetical protein